MNTEQYLVKYWRKIEGSEFWECVEETVSVGISSGNAKDNHERAGRVILSKYPSARLVSIIYT